MASRRPSRGPTSERTNATTPESLGTSPIVRVADFVSGEARDGEGRVTPLGLPQADVLSFFAADGSRLVVRPSGTEPKVKFYLELVARVDSTAAVAAARQRLDAVGAEIRKSVIARLGLA